MRLWKNGPRKKSALPKGGASAAPAQADAPSADALAAEVQQLREQAAALEATLQEARQQHAAQVKRMLLGVIDAIDAFERVFASIKSKEDQVTPQMKLWVGNFRTILRLLQKVLTDNEAVAIQNLEGGFDAQWHQAFETVESATHAEGAIVEEVQKGYVWRDQILRKTSVVVACKAASPPAETATNRAQAEGPAPVDGGAASDHV